VVGVAMCVCPEQELHDADVEAVLDQPLSRRMPQGMRRHAVANDARSVRRGGRRCCDSTCSVRVERPISSPDWWNSSVGFGDGPPHRFRTRRKNRLGQQYQPLLSPLPK